VDPEGPEPVYLELADALELYAPIVGGTTAQAADQLRDRAGLESALGRPRNYALYNDARRGVPATFTVRSRSPGTSFTRMRQRPVGGMRRLIRHRTRDGSHPRGGCERHRIRDGRRLGVCEELLDRGRFERACEEEALSEVALFALKVLELRLVLNAFT